MTLAALRRQLAVLERAAQPLDPGPARRREVRGAIVASAERFLRSLDQRKAFEDGGGTGEGLLASQIGEEALPVNEIIRLLEQEVVRPGGNPASAGHLAYIPGGGLYYSALGDYIAAVTNKYAGIFFTGPGAVRMENQLLRWVADLVGYPAGALGNIASGGSIASLIAIATARDAHGLTAADIPRAVVYLTDQAHHCLEKALRIAGLGEVVVRHVPIDALFRMRPDALEAMIAADRDAGLRPWLVIAAAGTTDTGAVDPRADRAGGSAGAVLVPRRCRVRRLLPAHRAWPGHPARHRAVGLRGARPTQESLSPLRLRRRAGPRPAADAGDASLLRQLHAGRPVDARRGIARRCLSRAEQALPGTPHVAAAQAAGRGAVPRRAG